MIDVSFNSKQIYHIKVRCSIKKRRIYYVWMIECSFVCPASDL